MYGSKFVAYQDVIDKVLRVRELVRSLRYILDIPTLFFCNNKDVIVVVCEISIIIKKHSIVLSFYFTREVIVAEAVEL